MASRSTALATQTGIKRNLLEPSAPAGSGWSAATSRLCARAATRLNSWPAGTTPRTTRATARTANLSAGTTWAACRSAGAPGRLAAGSARTPGLLRSGDEDPLVVMRSAVVDHDRRGRALALNAPQDAALARAARLLTAARRLRLALPLRCAAVVERQEIVVGDRIFVFLAEELHVVELIEALRRGAGPHPALVKAEGPHVLLPAKEQLGFLFARRVVLPGGEGSRHPDGGHPHNHKEDDHSEASGVRL